MLRLKIVLLTAIVTCGQWVLLAQDADAGCLRDFFRRLRRPAAQATFPTAGTTAFSPATQTASAGNFAGLQPGQCMKTCQQTCSRVVVNYVPCTSYRTTYERVPVTSYRPQTSSDPCTGCQVTCMRPCTTYTYRTRRVPYTTYRPVYRTESYKVPVTTIVNDCNGSATCNTCTTGAAPTTFGQPTFGSGAVGGSDTRGQTVPSGTLSTNGSFGTQPSFGTPTFQSQPNFGSTTFGAPPVVPPGSTVTPLPTPADTSPGFNPQNLNRSVIDGVGGSATKMQAPQTRARNWTLTSTKPAKSINRNWSNVPVVDIADKSPVTRKWSYSPVKQASYVSLDEEESQQSPVVTMVRGSFAPISKAKAQRDTVNQNDNSKVNSGWKTVQW